MINTQVFALYMSHIFEIPEHTSP